MIAIPAVAPYASFVAAHTKVPNPDAARLVRQLRALFPTSSKLFDWTDLKPMAIAGFDGLSAFHLKEKRSVTWSGKNKVEDQLNHLVAIFIANGFALIYMSDGELKSDIHNALFAGHLSEWEPVDERVLVNAYVTGNALRTLWLGGTHRNLPIRPNSKVMSGKDLNDAIEPFGDSTFLAGAVRSSKAGVSLKRSGIWFGPMKEWGDLCALAMTVLAELAANQLNIASLSASVHEGLAQAVGDFNDVKTAYEIEWVDPETVNGRNRAKKLDQIRARYGIELVLSPVPDKNISVRLTDLASGKTDDVVLEPALTSSKVVEFKVVGKVSPALQNCVDTLRTDPGFVRVYYESWHTITDATLSLAAVQDRDFVLEYCNFGLLTECDVGQEKPKGQKLDLPKIFTSADNSLFKWVFQKGLAQLGLAQPSTGRCWLYCDDGAGEVADFIHVALPPYSGITIPKITLVHVKGANNNGAKRKISAGAYEVVAAQAMKNLRRMISNQMLLDIKNTVDKHGDERTWDQPWALGLTSSPQTGQALLNALKNIKSVCDYEVIILQPHVLKSKYQTLTGPSTDVTAVQLRSLLFGVKSMTQAAGATLRVVCDDR
ncbi:hypothetical protein HSX11_18720 [Oxalobacteraceae bacterium]|nr:hypothetical protein [Oxalobacteraceae bacterium]